jgi:methylase of polypeptide subunit release factors
VTKDTLIPRPETEYMLESVHQFFDQRDIGNQVVLWDVGT